jgi:heavy metal sensor kinase
VRVRVTLAFTAVMAVLLAALAVFLYVRLGTTLKQTVDTSLHSRAADVSTLVKEADTALAQSSPSRLTARGENLAQILDRGGRVVDAPPRLRARPLLTPAEVARAGHRTIVVEHPSSSPQEAESVRLLATPVTAQDQHLIVVVGASMEPTEDALYQLRRLLAVGGPIALLLAALAGYGAAAGALRPVEQMRRRAAEIQASRPGRRLPVPPSHDELGRLGATLNAMLERLEDAFAHERQFVADASHELRTPIAILKGELELALRHATDVEGFRLAVASAAEEADRLVQLAEDLLVIARSDQGRLPVRLADVDVEEVLQRVHRRFARRALEHGGDIALAPSTGLRVVADDLRLEQALGNMVDNALRHGGGHVSLAAVAENGTIALHVRDDGAGFPPGFLDRAFERFSRSDAARTGGGSGLGLAIVRAIARAHGGDAHARNSPDGGADVWMDLRPAPPGRAT